MMVDEAFFDALFRINVRGAYFVIKHAVEIMPDGGSIILTSSISGALGVAGQTVYGATKAAVRSFGRTFARELAPRRIRVSAGRNHLMVTGIPTMPHRIRDIEGRSQSQYGDRRSPRSRTRWEPRGDWRRDGPHHDESAHGAAMRA